MEKTQNAGMRTLALLGPSPGTILQSTSNAQTTAHPPGLPSPSHKNIPNPVTPSPSNPDDIFSSQLASSPIVKRRDPMAETVSQVPPPSKRSRTLATSPILPTITTDATDKSTLPYNEAYHKPTGGNNELMECDENPTGSGTHVGPAAGRRSFDKASNPKLESYIYLPNATCTDSVSNNAGLRPLIDAPQSGVENWDVVLTSRSGRKPFILHSFFPFLASIVLLLSVINCVHAVPHAAASLSIYALNANGLVYPGKVAAINTAIAQRAPHIFVISETKTNARTARNLPRQQYIIHEEVGVPSSGHHIFKWGVVLGIKNGIQIMQRVSTPHPSLRGRLIAVDIVIPTDDGRGFPHRIVAAYAPWDPGEDDNTRNFWGEVAKVCNSAQHGWTLSGDLNATVHSSERQTGGGLARTQYLNFLTVTDGHDLWSDYPERSRHHEWTSSPYRSTNGGSIIDRVATSRTGIHDSEIAVANRSTDYIPKTDHRAVVARIIHRTPTNGDSHARFTYAVTDLSLNKPRIKYPPANEKHRFQTFRDQMDAKIEQEGLRLRPVIDDESFKSRYSEFTRNLLQTAEESFGRVKRTLADYRKLITTPKIERILAGIKQLGGAIRMESSAQSYSVSYSTQQTHWRLKISYLHDIPDAATQTFREYLVAERKKKYKELYVERTAEAYA
jgi:hypothetical protein